MTEIVPIFSTATAENFCSSRYAYKTEIALNAQVITNYLKVGCDIDLLSLSYLDVLETLGLVDATDHIDPAITLDAVLITFLSKESTPMDYVFSVNPYLNPTASFVFARGHDYRHLAMRYTESVALRVEGDESIRVRVVLNGFVDLELGKVRTQGEVTLLEDNEQGITNLQVTGYKLNANRVNPRRQVNV